MLCVQIGLRHFVTGENRGCCAEFRAHVGDSRALGYRKAFYPGSRVLQDFADAAFDRESPADFENDVFGRHPGLKFTFQANFQDLGHLQVVGSAAHSDRNIEAAGADGEHAETAAGRGVAVRTQQGVAGHSESLDMHLMTDTVTRFGEKNPVLRCHGLEILVVVSVLEARLQHIVIHIGDRKFGLHLG